MTAETHPNPVVQWGKISLLGIGQCALSGNVISGALILVGVGRSAASSSTSIGGHSCTR